MGKKRDVYKELAALQAKHGSDRRLIRSFPDLSVAAGAPSLSDGFAPVIDNRAKTLRDRFKHEPKASMDAIETKASRIRITVSKSAYQYATESDNPASAHRKGC